MDISYSVGSLIVFPFQTNLLAKQGDLNNLIPHISLLESVPEFPRARVTLMTLGIAVLINAIAVPILWANTSQIHGCIHSITATARWKEGAHADNFQQKKVTFSSINYPEKRTWCTCPSTQTFYQGAHACLNESHCDIARIASQKGKKNSDC